MDLYLKVSLASSKLLTKAYSTSFSLGIRTLDDSVHDAIYAIYGFVRLADEIVDTFHSHDKKALLDQFTQDTFQAIEEKISLNPILHSFQWAVNEFQMEHELIHAFLYSMEMDLTDRDYDEPTYKKYIYGSADVVGLMCLKVFVKGDNEKYHELKDSAMSLGSAFQKVNFLRDLKADHEGLDRSYFPNADLNNLDEMAKLDIIQDIEQDFAKGLQGIKMLPIEAKFGVFMAYRYYNQLLKKLKKTPALQIKQARIRVSNHKKIELLMRSYVKYQLNLM